MINESLDLLLEMFQKNIGKTPKKVEGLVNIFVSHSSEEKELAKYFSSWLEKINKRNKCFCSSRPVDLPPGKDWLLKIVQNSRKSNYCLVLVSPESSKSDWLYFESGLVFGSNPNNTIIPVVYGGMTIKGVSGTLKHVQILSLNDEVGFNAMISEYFDEKQKEGTLDNRYQDFVSGMSEQLKRLLNYGICSQFLDLKVTTKSVQLKKITKETSNQPTQGLRVQDGKEISSIRISFAPRRMGAINQWKLGLKVLNGSKQVFHLHAGSHEGFTSWTIFYSHKTSAAPINIPRRLELDKNCGLQLWFNKNRNEVICVGIDSDGNKVILKNENGESVWFLTDDWDRLQVIGWAEGNDFQIDNIQVEVDRT